MAACRGCMPAPRLSNQKEFFSAPSMGLNHPLSRIFILENPRGELQHQSYPWRLSFMGGSGPA
ncbi:hypothetical protein NP590_07110 [Methylomonas sp. SURF-2]|uniref:Uncharacterized protein n=1 Tax=Methylomonas subterranea TaxID=2952225 RepID=A0ABT1TEH9_9GAMM|nr:hypothetical protein [Methylomonas sp. SURF-2]MCQ8103868.1 hypothetical protein [Methylomonas sp. SURF-2]